MLCFAFKLGESSSPIQPNPTQQGYQRGEGRGSIDRSFDQHNLYSWVLHLVSLSLIRKRVCLNCTAKVGRSCSLATALLILLSHCCVACLSFLFWVSTTAIHFWVLLQLKLITIDTQWKLLSGADRTHPLWVWVGWVQRLSLYLRIELS